MYARHLMRAARIHAFGDEMRIDDVPEPNAGPGEVMLDVSLAAVNPVDVWMTDGTVAGGNQPLPFVPGVEAVGFNAGRAVVAWGGGIGLTRDGLYRERAAVPNDAVADVPPGVAPERFAGVAVAGTTAWVVTNELAKVGPDDRVLILGASGGVGTLAVQLAKAAGATVWGQTSSTEKVSFIDGLGADRVAVSTAEGLGQRVKELEPTAALDPLGNGFTPALIDALQPFGRLVLFGASAGTRADMDLRQLYRKSIQLLTYSGTIEDPARNRAALEGMMAAVARGEARVIVDETLPLEAAAEAHRRIRERRVAGKLLLAP
ncbi:MAG: zinc-binding alcohol dehydrogenase family protein [Actinomycetota bacterium]